MDNNVKKEFFLTKYLKTNSNNSLMRLITFEIVQVGCALAIALPLIDLIKGTGSNLLSIATLVGGIFGIALGGKILQTKEEIKVEGTKPSTSEEN